jgi:hypothetical protein
MDIVREMRFESISNAFGNNFVNSIAETDGSMIFKNFSDELLWDESYMSGICMGQKDTSSEKVLDNGMYVVTYSLLERHFFSSLLGLPRFPPCLESSRYNLEVEEDCLKK